MEEKDRRNEPEAAADEGKPLAPLRPQEILRRHHLWPKKALGQNFLCDLKAAEKIVAAAAIDPERETVVEIGPGLGALTFPLARTGARVVAVEKDAALAAILRDRLGRKYRDQVRVIVGDAMDFSWDEAPGPVVVVGNLPYQITSPLLFKLLAAPARVARAVLTMQREVADRLLSPPGPKAYGQLTVLVQLKARVEPVLTLPPGAFHPAPGVSSRAVRLTLGQTPPLPIADETFLVMVVKAAFAQRRKTLRQALSGAPMGLSAAGWAEAFAAAGIDPGLRAERLSPAEFIALANAALDRRHPPRRET